MSAAHPLDDEEHEPSDGEVFGEDDRRAGPAIIGWAVACAIVEGAAIWAWRRWRS